MWARGDAVRWRTDDKRRSKDSRDAFFCFGVTGTAVQRASATAAHRMRSNRQCSRDSTRRAFRNKKPASRDAGFSASQADALLAVQ
ncbi:hypothetical protein C84B14_07273 [Salinisphaera sp. C84B14]